MAWKRWNQKGSVHAHRRMAELRDRKLQVEKGIAIDDWAARTGRAAGEWWQAAQEAGLTRESSIQDRIAFLRN